MLTARASLAAATIAVALGARAVVAQAPPVTYSCRFVKIPMRDGIHLNTSVCEPPAPHEPLPFLLTRTPYGTAADTVVPVSYRFLAADGYIFVSQDIRGRYGSEGSSS